MEHRAYFGMTLSGKTTKAKEDLRKEKNFGRIFVNLIDKNRFEGFEQLDGNTDKKIIENLLVRKRLIQYNANPKYFDKEVLALKDIAMKVGGCILLVDECHLLDKGTYNTLKHVWTGGRHEEVYGWVISQRPQLIDRTILTQSKKIIFKMNLEDSWLKSYGIPTEMVPKENYKFLEIL